MGSLVPILLLIFSYLMGSIPWALIISKLYAGVDVREYGSKNMGATNVLRVVGKKQGIAVFILDALKASIVILLFTFGLLNYKLDWMAIKIFTLKIHIHPLVYGVASLIGHLFPVFAKFKGGKGVSCCAGIVFAYNPIVFICAFTGFVIVFLITKYISMGSITAGIIALTMSFLPFNKQIDWIFVVIMMIAFFFLVVRHIPNIKRVINHTEPKTILFKPKDKK